jgi:hypothetical protein
MFYGKSQNAVQTTFPEMIESRAIRRHKLLESARVFRSGRRRGLTRQRKTLQLYENRRP